VQLSSAGAQLVEHARTVLRDYEELKSVARRLKDPSAGQYRLGVIPTLAPYLLPRVVPAIHADFPRLRLILIEDKTDQLLARLRRGLIDIALLALPVKGDDLQCIELFDEAFCLAVSDHHPLATSDDVGASDLSNHHLLLLDEGHCLRDQALEFCKQNAIEESNEFRATSLETLIQMVATDLGITLVPEMAAREPARNLKFIPFREPKPHRTIGLVWRRNASQQDFFERIGHIIASHRADAAG
jgi:LysR family hydrogen peroxide-inducible transcriptional activator